VVADNCTDDTASRARACGAEVAERFDSQRRGKGHALAFGLDQLRAEPPSLVVFIDADCTLEAHALERLAATVLATGRPAQARYLMLAPEGSGLGQRFAEFTWRIRNSLRPAGGLRLGMPCQLMGTGMAFTWAMLATVEVGTGSIVEDMALGVDLAVQSQPPVFCPAAVVLSRFPTAAQAQDTQQTRWIHGHLAMLLSAGPRLAAAAWRRRDAQLLGMALDLSVPPLTLLGAALFAATLLAWAAGASFDAISPSTAPARWHWPTQALCAAALAFAAVLAAAWRAEGQDLISRRELLRLPLLLPAKLRVLFRFISRRQDQWIRTDRDKR
jgi:cellulose synthase/poly-beta-1,6-N-acetylglucosamine synthase-like glycosyltransferase